MSGGKKRGHLLRFLRLHTPQAVLALPDAQHIRPLAMVLQLLTNLVRDQIGLGDEDPKWLLRRLPPLTPANLPGIRHRNDQLDRRMEEAPLICSPHDFSNDATPARLPPK